MTLAPARAFPPIEELLPHRGTMLLLDRVVSADERSIVAERTVPAEGWYLAADASMPAWIGIELMAQAIAAHVSLEARAQGRPPKPGVLLGCRRYQAGIARVPAGERLRVSARLSYRDQSGFGAYDCAIEGAAAQLATATLKVYQPPDFRAFISQIGV